MNTKDFETGYENEEHIGPILPDRLTNVHPKGSDHPTPFAKGTYDHDTTIGAIPAEILHLPEHIPESTRLPQVDEEDVVDSSTIQVSEEVIQQATKRDFGDDSDLEYIPREEFAGRKEGFVFRLGSRGIGYYTDRYYKPKEAAETASS